MYLICHVVSCDYVIATRGKGHMTLMGERKISYSPQIFNKIDSFLKTISDASDNKKRVKHIIEKLSNLY